MPSTYQLSCYGDILFVWKNAHVFKIYYHMKVIVFFFFFGCCCWKAIYLEVNTQEFYAMSYLEVLKKNWQKNSSKQYRTNPFFKLCDLILVFKILNLLNVIWRHLCTVKIYLFVLFYIYRFHICIIYFYIIRCYIFLGNIKNKNKKV